MSAKHEPKFKLSARQAVDEWGNDCDLPVYDGLHLFTNEAKPRHVGKILWDSKTKSSYLQLDTDEELDDFIDSQETFKEFCTIIKLAKFHIRLAHNIASNDSDSNSD